MVSQRKKGHARVEDGSRREQRADKILDAAEESMLRWGYNKTTIEDIARLSGVSKGTIYLHWKTREDLFLALLEREYARLVHDIEQRIAGDPDGGTLEALIKHSMLATLKSPLMKAVLLRDKELIGEWIRREYASATYNQQIAQPLALLELYRSRGVLRDDIDVRKMVYMLDAITMGFLVIDQYMPEDFRYSEEEVAEMTGETVKRTFTPALSANEQPDEQAEQELATNFISSLENVLTIRSQRNEEEATS